MLSCNNYERKSILNLSKRGRYYNYAENFK